jgi:hypothetical protein
MAKAKMKKTEQAKSVAVITIMEKGSGLVITSEGCGGAGEYADQVVELIRSVFESAGQAAE